MSLCVLLEAPQTLIVFPEDVEKSESFPHTLRMKIRVQKTGGIWHGYIEGHPEIDERGLTEEIARRKVERIVERMGAGTRLENPEAKVLSFERGKR